MYSELICHTHYSFLYGASRPEELIQKAYDLNLSGIAITDRNGVYGVPKAYRAIQLLDQTKRPHPLKLIVGAELKFEEDFEVYLIALTRRGYGLLCRILTASHENKEKGKAALSVDRYLDLLKGNEQGAKELVCLLKNDQVYPFLEFKEIFSDRLYLSLFRAMDGNDQKRTERVLFQSKKFEIPIVATNRVLFHLPHRKKLHDVVNSIRENKSLKQMGRLLLSNSEFYLKSPEEMKQLFCDLPSAVENTLRISERCRFSPGELRYYYPSEWIPLGETAISYLEKLTWEGARRRYQEVIPHLVREQLRRELDLIRELNFADYFLTIWEIVDFANKRKILCQGRGSAANSAVCFCLGITAVDPVRMNLLFERFISAERGEPPDIDVDFEHERREEVIQHIYQKYGRDRAAMVSAVITYRSRSALRDVRKVFQGTSVQEEGMQVLIDEIRGFPRHLSIHSGGFTLSADPIIETVPVEPARMPGRTIIQWDKEDLDFIGLLKVDILALGMLSAIRKSLDLINREKKEGDTFLSLATIPANDSLTYQMIQKGNTVGVFQIESRAQMNMLRRLLPKTFYDLVIQVAIVRPGPIQGQMVHPYLRRRKGIEPIDSPDPRIDAILSRTLGVPLFQEQVMKIAMTMGGFSPGEADELRRAIGAWKSSGAVDRIGQKLKKRLLAQKLPQEFVERIFKQIQGFAEYGFPESHAASFALLAYASSYLKAHFPAEFICSILNSLPMGFYSAHTLIEEVKRSNVEVLPVSIQDSEWESQVIKGELQVGLHVVLGLRKSSAEEMILERKVRKFSSLEDFLSRTHLSQKSLSVLAMGDAFRCFGKGQREVLWAILSSSLLKSKRYRFSQEETHEQLSLFQCAEVIPSSLNQFQPLSFYESIQEDYRSFQLSVRGHPMAALRKEPSLRFRISSESSLSVKRAHNGKNFKVSGLVIVRQRPQTAKGTVFATLEDEFGFVDLIFHERVYQRYEEVMQLSPFISVRGSIQRDGEMVNLIVRQVQGIFRDQEDEAVSISSRDFH